MKWLPWHEDDWPDWAHTTALLVIAAVFGLPWLWLGAAALVSGHLPPTPGPEFGLTMFGEQALTGRAARAGGCAMLLLGLAILACGLAFTRHASAHAALRWLPWCLLGGYGLVYRWTVTLA
jgi:hypothetical protein